MIATAIVLAVCVVCLAGVGVAGRVRRRTPPPMPHRFPSGGDPGLTAFAVAPARDVAAPPLHSVHAFEAWQGELRERIRTALLGMTPLEVPGVPRCTEVAVDPLDDGITRFALAIEGFDGTQLPAYLFVPGQRRSGACVLVLPGHVEREHDSGLAQTSGLVQSYHRGAALEMAKRGFVSLTLELRGFGVLGPPRYPEHRAVAHNAILAGSSYKAVLVRDLKRAADALLSRQEVDPSRFCITGVSFGGELAAVYAAVDTRVRALAVNSVTAPLGPFPAATGTRREQQPHYCHTVPGENAILLQEHWYYLVAPRPMLCVNGGDDFHPPDGTGDYILAPYKAFGLDALSSRIVVPGRNHEFFVGHTAEFFEQHVGGPRAGVAAGR